MKNLYLVRHAKSSWEYDMSDHERPLNNRGYKDANLVSNYLKDSLKLPDLVISSDAVRAKTTATIFVDNLDISDTIFQLDYSLYDFRGLQLEEVIKNCDDSIDTLMIFGHNHAMTYFVNTYGNKPIGNVATSGFTHLEFDIDSWNDLKKGNTKQTLFPKELKNK